MMKCTNCGQEIKPHNPQPGQVWRQLSTGHLHLIIETEHSMLAINVDTDFNRWMDDLPFDEYDLDWQLWGHFHDTDFTEWFRKPMRRDR